MFYNLETGCRINILFCTSHLMTIVDISSKFQPNRLDKNGMVTIWKIRVKKGDIGTTSFSPFQLIRGYTEILILCYKLKSYWSNMVTLTHLVDQILFYALST